MLSLALLEQLKPAFIAAALAIGQFCASSASIEAKSPSGKLRASVFVNKSGQIMYSVRHGASEVIEPSPLGVTVAGEEFAMGAELGTPRKGEIMEVYPTRGIHSFATNWCRTLDIPVQQKSSGKEWTLEFRIYDDGVGWRYRIPGSGSRLITGEASAWTLPQGTRVWFAERNNPWKLKSYAGEWKRTVVDDLPTISEQGPVQGPPLIAELPKGGYAVVTEAAVFNYSGLRLRATGNRRLVADFTEGAKGFELDGDIVTPWRVVLWARDLDALVNSDLVSNLCPPPDMKLFSDTSWIRPGRCAWRWWTLRIGTPEQERQIIDSAASLGFEYTIVDEGWEQWPDTWKAVRDLCEHAHLKKVGVFLWKRYDEVASPAGDWSALREFLRKVAESGASGVKLDFLNAESLDRIRFEEAALRIAAEHKLLVNFHGCRKPGGESRTYPNEVTREAVRGLELNGMKEGPITPEHNAALPFTRFVVGPGDYTPLGFSNPGPTTFAHQLATVIAFTSPLQVIAENPEWLLTRPEFAPALDALKAIPSTWDETRVLPPSAIGELAILARRSGKVWFLAILNGSEGPRKIELRKLPFLGGVKYRAQWYSSPEQRQLKKVSEARVGRSRRLELKLSAGDGFVGVLVPENAA